MHLLILRRLLQAIPTLWVIATATFILMQLTPGGPFDTEKDILRGSSADQCLLRTR